LALAGASSEKRKRQPTAKQRRKQTSLANLALARLALDKKRAHAAIARQAAGAVPGGTGAAAQTMGRGTARGDRASKQDQNGANVLQGECLRHPAVACPLPGAVCKSCTKSPSVPCFITFSSAVRRGPVQYCNVFAVFKAWVFFKGLAKWQGLLWVLDRVSLLQAAHCGRQEQSIMGVTGLVISLL